MSLIANTGSSSSSWLTRLLLLYRTVYLACYVKHWPVSEFSSGKEYALVIGDMARTLTRNSYVYWPINQHLSHVPGSWLVARSLASKFNVLDGRVSELRAYTVLAVNIPAADCPIH